MRAVSTSFAIGTVLWLAAFSAQAVGFGRITNTTQLGQPLNFAAAVRLEPDETLPLDCVSAEVQSGDNKLGAGQVRISVDGSPDPNERIVRITTNGLIDEPVVTVSITVGCNSKLTRRFVAFVDPPVIALAQAAPPAETAPPRSESATPPAPAVAPAPRMTVPTRPVPTDRSAAAARPPRDRAAATSTPRPAARAPREIAVAAPARPRPATPTRQPAVARAAAPGPRLQLEAAAPPAAGGSAPKPIAAASAPAAASAAATLTAAAPVPATPAAAAASMPDDAASAAAERQRVKQLEDGLAALQKKSRENDAALATLQARVNEAESARNNSPLVLVLAVLCALLALIAGLLWWRQRRLGAAGQWWSGPPPEPAPSSAALLDPTPMAPPLVVPPLPAEPAAAIVAADPFTPSTFVEEDEPVDAGPAANALTVEELIDLEQQAEFFIVLGQDEAAIDLLMSHVRGDTGASPLPYLQLLEIHRRRGDEAAYRRIRDRFSQRFNANSPAWSADPLAGRTLAAYPETIVDLQQHWFAPGRVMKMLEAALFRRDASDATFDLPAYRELLFLYSIAHDLAEHGDAAAPTNVDLLLPLGPGDPPIATQPMAAIEAAERLSLDVDVTAPPPAPAPAPTDIHLIDFDLDPPPPPKPGSGR